MFGPVDAITMFFARSLNFTGRATRAEYWWVQLLFVVTLFALVMRDVTGMTQSGGAMNPLFLLTPWLCLLVFIPMLSLIIRRLHDVGLSGWWYLITFVPVIGGLAILVFMLLPSQNRPNKWGDPRDPEDPLPQDHPGYAIVADDRPAPQAGKPVRARKRSAWDSYAILDHVDRAPSPQEQEARRAITRDYYERHILKKAPTA